MDFWDLAYKMQWITLEQLKFVFECGEITREQFYEILEIVIYEEDKIYNKADKVIFNGGVYESIIDKNELAPSENPQSWREVEL